MRELKKTRERKAHLTAIGLDPEQLTPWRMKWKTFKGNALDKGCGCEITFEQYTDLAVKAGIISPEHIGCSIGSFQMGRIGDKGDYVIGNCRFIKAEQNILEKRINGGHDAASDKRRGKSKYDDEGFARTADKQSKNFLLIDPEGKEHQGRNIGEFCKLNGLNQGAMSAVCRGAAKQHKGWKGKYLE